MISNFRFVSGKIFWINVKKFLVLFGIAFFIFLLDFGPFFTGLKCLFQGLFNPIYGHIYQINQSFLSQTFSSKEAKSYFLENQKLQTELSRCQGETVSLQQVFDENKQLRHLLTMPLPSDLSFNDSMVIGNQGDCLIINKGVRDGVEEKQLVLVDNYLVGQVEKVLEKQAKILRVDSIRFSTPVLIFKDDPNCVSQNQLCRQGKGVTHGTKVEQILREEPVAEGNLIALLDGPKGVLVGRVIKVNESSDKVFLEAKFEPLVDFNKLTAVFLVR
ncbi:hypothetical protein COT63_01440 [Candidatus Shapirobacteria bacterium CG09_land_8_20_14_0_10_38_17]|uniref:Cell shape-determining protein MreC n=1 Tax=Candidatus Shapirobacteria bacterium CG09_land_8_20_14_0_10_38_17 TaxID=1974884 RepID=A0A2H0WTD4_9BACT|nr:MAG: hypothetical protein COT63_01440 [Candidatus Shapirobacteria bacterium CG09_land_8_20_14_0_10_38_17]